MINKTDWENVKFGDVVRLNTDRIADPAAAGIEWYVGLEHIESEDLRIRSWGLVAEGITFTNYFKPGQTLFGKRRAYQRKVAVADFEGICSGDIYVFEPKDERLLPELLPFICQTERFYEYAVGTSAGSLSPRTNWTQLAQYEFALPPLAEQCRMAKVLECSRNTVEAMQQAIASLRQLRKSAIDDLCIRFDDNYALLGNICAMQNGRAFPGEQYQEKGTRLLRPGNLGVEGYLDWDSDRTICLPKSFEEKYPDYIIKPGDIVINLTAQSLEDGFMGRVCLAKEGDHSLLNQRIGRFIFNSTHIIPEYIYRVLQSSPFQQRTISMCEGTKVKHLYWRHLEGFEFNLPPINEQYHVVEVLREIDKSIENFTKRWEQQQRLHTLLLNKSLVVNVTK
jgi:type I restriction enzyme, S subunit